MELKRKQVSHIFEVQNIRNNMEVRVGQRKLSSEEWVCMTC